ncbi:hypothetical protein MSAN_01600200 [Mycena sanguinolenta]|uniref:Uncharacterized protein n=1 Tax=Mycena sanguinolenta TaxID=230812 RepID=A0A8H7CY47_9AGAR|nr:hypothetical protein MSAN_01600200 [Mycena sanguinolenta]
MGVSLSTAHVSSWQQECASRFNCTSSGLVDIFGQAASCPANSTIQSVPGIWGITYEACQAECGMDKIVQSIDFTSAAVPLTTWLLPWIALIAQLPFEANGWRDLLSACLCVGSPALATYSLALTTFNRRYITNKFKRLKEKAEKDTQQRYHYMAQRAESAAFVLQEIQQCPMRADQRSGELASLIVLPDRQNFWLIAAKDLNNTRRGFTYSFLAQVILAFLSYLISFIAAVHDSLGSPDVGLQFASSSVWSWMFPIVYGYIRVGSQFQAGAIKQALVDNTILPQRGVSAHGTDVAEVMYQKGLRPDADVYTPLLFLETPGRLTLPSGSSSALSAAAQSTQSAFGGEDIALEQITFRRDGSVVANSEHQRERSEKASLLSRTDTAELEGPVSPPTWLGIDVRGDERREGPIFNYARILTWFAFAEHVRKGFETAINRFRVKPKPATPVGPDTTFLTVTVEGTPAADVTMIPLVTAKDAADCCRLAPFKDLPAFLSWEKIPSAAIRHMLYAAFLALFLLWGTTGAAIFVAYSTPAVGLGCRSGSYLIYGIAATVSWLLLVFSQFASHALMHRFEQDPDNYRLSTGYSVLGGLAVITRILGKTLAVANAGWLIASSVLEEIGAFQTCWCQTDAFQYHTSGWTPVFKAATDLRSQASGIWIGGFTWSIVVCIITAVIFT